MFTAALPFRGEKRAYTAVKAPRNLRARHVAVLTSILHISLLKRQYERAFHAYSLLLRCKDADIRRIWDVGLEILHNTAPERVVEFIKRLIAAYPASHRSRKKAITAEHFFTILIRRRISCGEFREAFDEVVDQLLVFPYSENPELHYYAGAIALHLASLPGTNNQEKQNKLAYAQKAFSRMRNKTDGEWVNNSVETL